MPLMKSEILESTLLTPANLTLQTPNSDHGVAGGIESGSILHAAGSCGLNESTEYKIPSASRFKIQASCKRQRDSPLWTPKNPIFKTPSVLLLFRKKGSESMSVDVAHAVDF